MTTIVTGMYIFAGFRDKLVAVEADGNESGAETIKSALGGGEIECAVTISGYAFSAERVANRVYDESSEPGPGVWEYEVAEELGRWLADYVLSEGEAPTDMEWEDEVEHRTRQFIARSA